MDALPRLGGGQRRLTRGSAETAGVGRAAGRSRWAPGTSSTAYPVASDFAEMPVPWWYMGDIPHGWAAAEFMLLLRDMLFFEAGEDDARHLYLAPGILPRWLRGGGGQGITVTNAATTYASPFGYTLAHDEANQQVTIDITQPVPGVTCVYPCRLGAVTTVSADSADLPVAGNDVRLPAGTMHAVISYA